MKSLSCLIFKQLILIINPKNNIKYFIVDTMFDPVIQNIVCTFSTDCILNLKQIALCALNVEYKPQRFGALIMRIRSPRATALMFKSGKIVVAGVKIESDAIICCKKFVKILCKLDFKAKFLNFKIQNIVCSFNMFNYLSLEKIHYFSPSLTCYEPELFPGLILKIKLATLLIFGSGKVVITGCNNYPEIKNICNNVYLSLLNFKK